MAAGSRPVPERLAEQGSGETAFCMLVRTTCINDCRHWSRSDSAPFERRPVLMFPDRKPLCMSWPPRCSQHGCRRPVPLPISPAPQTPRCRSCLRWLTDNSSEGIIGCDRLPFNDARIARWLTDSDAVAAAGSSQLLQARESLELRIGAGCRCGEDTPLPRQTRRRCTPTAPTPINPAGQLPKPRRHAGSAAMAIPRSQAQGCRRG